jgi:glycine/D-amino acid oxidase-like deaminating enzyme
VLATSPLAPLDHQFPVYADHGFNYWHQRRDGRMVVGGFRHLDLTGECGTDLVLHPAIQDRLTQLAEDLAGGPVEVLHRWAGIMAMAKDHLPYVGMVNKRLGIALGYSGHGSTVTPAAARMLSEAVLHHTPVFPALSAARLDLGSRDD